MIDFINDVKVYVYFYGFKIGYLTKNNYFLNFYTN